MTGNIRKRSLKIKFLIIITIVLSIVIFAGFKNVTLAAGQTGALNLQGTDTTKAQGVVINYLEIFGAAILVFSLGLTGLRMILTKNSENKREEVMTTLLKIIVGTVILGGCLLISGFLISVANDVGSSLAKVDLSNMGITLKNPTDDDKGTFVVSAIASIFSAIAKCVFGLFNATLGFVSLDKLIFNSNSSTALFGVVGKISIPPFTDVEWNNLNHVYLLVSSICAPIVLVMVAKTGFSLLMSANKPFERSILQEDMSRWFFSLALIAIGPFLIKGLFIFCGDMTDAIAAMFKISIGAGNYITDINTIQDIKTGSVLTTAIVECIYAWKYFQINMLFMVRKIVLTSFYAFTPIAALFWGINNKTQAIQIWFGEMITNATMQFFYAFTFSVMFISVSGSTWQNWFYTIVWMFALIKIAEVLRNSLQGLFTRIAGIDEASIMGKSFGPISSIASGAVGAMKRTFAGNGISTIRNGIGNMSSFRSSALGALSGNPLSGSKNPTGPASGAKDEVSSAGLNGINTMKKSPSNYRGGMGPSNGVNNESNENGTDNTVLGNKAVDNNKVTDNDFNGLNAEMFSNSGENKDAKGVSNNDIKNTPANAISSNPTGGLGGFNTKETGKNSFGAGIPGANINNPIGSGDNTSTYSKNQYESDNPNVGGAGNDGFNNGLGYNESGDQILNSDKFKGMDIANDLPIEDANGNINLSNLRQNANKHMFYTDMLNSNIKKHANNPSTSSKILSGFGRATGFSEKGGLSGISGGGIANRIAVGAAINDTVKQMQNMAGGSDKLSKGQALAKLFGGSTDTNGKIGSQTRGNVYQFKRAMIKGNVGRASQLLANNSPVNKLNPKQRDILIARTNSYTNVDGYTWR